MTGIPFAFQIGGKDIDPADIDNPEAAKILDQIVESIVDRAGELVCAEHGEPPRFICTGPDIDNLSLEIEGCCEKLVEQVKARLNS